jgi:hypothetical protein
MTKTVWEDTLIFALRDLQWRKAIALHANQPDDLLARTKEKDFPGLLLKFDGNAESKVGDVLTTTPKGHFFLIEFKAGKTEVASEWEGKGKYLYHFLSALCDITRHTNAQVRAVAKKMITVCLSAHHLAYWTEERKNTPVISTGAISCLPYLEGVRASLQDELTKTGIHDYGYLPLSHVQMTIGDFFGDDLPSHEYRDRRRKTESIAVKSGIDIHSMQTYLEWLAHDKNDDSVKIALLDSELQVVAMSAKLRDLLAITNELVMRHGNTNVASLGGSGKKSKQIGLDPEFTEHAKDVAALAHRQAAKAVAALKTQE